MIHFLLNLRIFKTFRFKLYRDTWGSIRNLSKTGVVSEIRKIIFEMHNSDLYNKEISKSLWDNPSFPDHKLALKQFFVQSLGYHKISTMMIYYIYKKNKKLIFPLPKIWQDKFKKSKLGIKTHSFLCSILYSLFIFYSILRGIFRSFKNFFEIIKKKFLNSYLKKNEKNYIIIPNYPLYKSRLDKSASEFNIIEWLKKNKKYENFIFIDKNKKKIEVLNQITIVQSLNDIFLEKLNIFSFIFDFLKYFLLCIYDLILLRYGSFLLFQKLTQYLLVKNSDSKRLKFLFVWENNIERPLWSYVTELQPEIINLSNFNELRNNKENKLSYDFEGYFISSWDIYNVWTEQCKTFLKSRLSNNPLINVVGPIFSYDLGLKLQLPKKNIIAIFGYETHKWSCGISTISEYQNQNLFLFSKFYNDILEVVKDKDIYIAIKRKKEFKQLEKKYIKNIFENLKKHPQVIYVDPKISPYRLIQNTNCTISMPFTSTSVAAKYLNKDSIYYDPINKINEDDPSRCDLKVIKNKNNLSKWINSQFNIDNI